MNDTTTSQAPQTALCTLFEGDYHYGLAAFVNSLFRAGYQGTVWVGYRGALPPWLGQLEPRSGKHPEFWLQNKIHLIFLPLDTASHLANYKPDFMLRLFDEAPDLDYLWYFDPDICLVFPWTFFAQWQKYGIALCEEALRYGMSERHPTRMQWKDLGDQIGLQNPSLRRGYYNSGLVGVQRSQSDFLNLWQTIIANTHRTGTNLQAFCSEAACHPFAMLDQDALNMATMYTAHPLSALGPEGMGFIPGWNAMQHAITYKPWRVSFLARALDGRRPSNAMRSFLHNAAGPIMPYSKAALARLRWSCSLASFISRFYCRD